MADERKFYRVINAQDLWFTRLPNYLEHGYETERAFRQAIDRLVTLWHDRVGESVDSRNEFLLLRFHDTPGGKPDEAWLPEYILKPEDVQVDDDKPDDPVDLLRKEIEDAFGFD